MDRARIVTLNAALGPLDYRVPDGMVVAPGSVVVAPLGPRQMLGVAWNPERLAITHFGTYGDVEDQIAAMHAALDRWGALARETDGDSFAAAMIAEMEQAPDATANVAFLQAMPPKTLWPGLDRYWSKRKG